MIISWVIKSIISDNLFGFLIIVEF